MKVTSVTTTEIGAPRSATGGWQITSLVEVPPLRFFRQVVRLSFETGDIADRIEIEPENTTLEAVFQPYDYDALAPSAPSKASLTTSGGAVIATLDAPRQIRQVRLSSGTVSEPGYAIEFYRLDGSTLADKPSASASVQSNVATLPSNVDFTDGRFAVRLKGPTGPSLKAGDLAGLQIRSYPTGPRLGIADPDDPDSAIFFWQASGELGKTVPADQGNVDAGEAFATVLGRYLDDFFARLAESTDGNGPSSPPPQFVDVALIVASDAPCTLNITAFDVTYHLVCQSFTSRGDKQVLRFSGDQATSQEVSVRLPGKATVTSATLETVESFRRDRPLASNDGMTDAAPAQKEGVYVGVERWVAQGITPSQATSVSGIAIALMTISSDTELLVELREDWGGQPSSRRLAAGMIRLEQVGKRSWATLLFPEMITLPSSLHWLLVKATSGRAVWLVDAGNGPARTLEGSSDSNVWTELSRFDGLQALYGFYSQGKQAQEQFPASLTIGTQAATTISEQNGTRIYDLTSTFNTYLDGLPSSTPATTIPLTFTSALPGLVTIYPPVIGYDLG